MNTITSIYRKISWYGVRKAIGLLLVFAGFFMVLCAPVSWYYREYESGRAILLSGFITVTSGLAMGIPGTIRKIQIRIKESYIIVTTSWIVISLFGTLPYLLSGSIPNFTDAFFETISGFTTTGASILSDIEALPKGILLWRSMTHWIGGIGIIVLFTAVMPMLGNNSMRLFSLENSSITMEKLHPQIKGTALRLSLIYLLLTVTETLLLYAGKMDLFDAVCHSFGTVATGGFSTQNSSIAGYSPYIQYVVAIFMLLAGINFSLHYFLFKGRVQKILKNDELKFYLKTIVFSTLLITTVLVLRNGTGRNIEASFRETFFQITSIVTCTGFITADYELWPTIGWVIIFLLMFSGGMAGSTAGGIKSFRHLLLFRIIRTDFYRRVHPNAVIPVQFNQKTVSETIILNVQAFFVLYIIVFIVGTLAMILTGMTAKSAAGGVASCLGGIGPGLGMLGAVSNYSGVSPVGKYILSLIMLLGRLEIFTLLMILSWSFWKK
ncbi:MAG: potassium transporter [Bacteroidetes bacterium]|nr:MAG: potassium transporter [Bacteroidota bacterium]PIE88360.1 MAG: potassium transporter [Bacteroidota bacterium]